MLHADGVSARMAARSRTPSLRDRRRRDELLSKLFEWTPPEAHRRPRPCHPASSEPCRPASSEPCHPGGNAKVTMRVRSPAILADDAAAAARASSAVSPGQGRRRRWLAAGMLGRT
eukprot:7963732-Pyramimonas_sp.AAC.1